MQFLISFVAFPVGFLFFLILNSACFLILVRRLPLTWPGLMGSAHAPKSILACFLASLTCTYKMKYDIMYVYNMYLSYLKMKNDGNICKNMSNKLKTNILPKQFIYAIPSFQDHQHQISHISSPLLEQSTLQ